MSRVIFVHGAFQGKFVWQPIIAAMKAYQFIPITPTLKGLADRIAESTPEINAHTHIEEIADLVRSFPETEPVYLIGHSYGSLITTGVAKLLPGRIKGLVFLDAPIPMHPEGESISLLDILGQDVAAFFGTLTQDGITQPFPPAAFGLSESDHQEIIKQHSSQSFNCFTDKVPAFKPGEQLDYPVAYIRCTPGNDFTTAQSKIARDLNWQTFEIESGHCPSITNPKNLTDLLVNQVFPKLEQIRLNIHDQRTQTMKA